MADKNLEFTNVSVEFLLFQKFLGHSYFQAANIHSLSISDHLNTSFFCAENSHNGQYYIHGPINCQFPFNALETSAAIKRIAQCQCQALRLALFIHSVYYFIFLYSLFCLNFLRLLCVVNIQFLCVQFNLKQIWNYFGRSDFNRSEHAIFFYAVGFKSKPAAIIQNIKS